MEVDNKLEEWKRRLDKVSSTLSEAVSKISESQLNASPAPGKWSIGQHIEHLIIINESYYPVLEEVSKPDYRPPWQGRVGFLVRLFGKIILNSIKPTNQKPTKTMPIWEPSTNPVDKSVLQRFENHQQELYGVMLSARDMLERNMVIPSPANSTIQYYLPQAFEIIVSHEERHLLAILRLIKAVES